MAQLVIAAAGAAIGSTFGMPTLGWAIGSMLGSALFPEKGQKVSQAQPLMDLRVTGSEYGQPIPYVRGAAGIAGQMWWNTDRRPTTTTTSSGGGGKGGGGPTVESSTTTYDMDCLIGLSGNEIAGVRRIWNNGDLIYTAADDATAGSIAASAATNAWTRLTVYTGSATQLPDPTYEAAVGSANACAYRGRGYVFIEGLKLGQSGQVPNLTFEVVADGSTTYNVGGTAAAAWGGTWDTVNHSSHLTLSGGNLTLTHDGSVEYFVNAGSSVGKMTGVWYCEIPIAQIGFGVTVGLSNLAYGGLDGSQLGDNASSWAYRSSNGKKRHNGVETAYGAPFTTGQIIGILFDFEGQTLEFFVDGVSQGVAFSSVSGYATLYAAVSLNDTGPSSNASVSGNFTAAHGFSYATSIFTVVPPAVDDVVSALCLRAGLAAGQIDVTGLAGITRDVRSMAISQIAPTRQALELLMAAYFFEMTVSDKIYFRARGGASVASIPYLDLGATAGGDQPEPLALKQSNDLELPAQIALSYVNVVDDYQTDTQYSDRLISAASGTVAAVQMALGMTPAEAKAVADTMLLDQAASNLTAPLALLGDYCRLEPTDPVTVSDKDGSTYRLRLVRKTDSYPLLTFDAVLDDVSVLTSQGITSADYTPSTVVAAPVATAIELMDIPILQDADNDAGFYAAAKGDGTPYAGSAIFNSADGVEYTRQATVLESAVFGVCTSTLGDWTGPRAFDEQNSVTVDVDDGTLASSTRDVVLNSAAVNAMLVGSELLQFRTATLVSAGVYKLTGLLRGGRGTEWAMTGHAGSERCVLLRTEGLRRIVLENSDLGLARWYKGVTLGRALSSATAEQFTDTALGLKPFAPFDLRATRDGSNNVTFTWQRRTRLATRAIGALGISVPLGEDSEAYEIDIYADGTYAAVLRTISATSATAAYSAAEQTADGLTPGNAVYARMYQLSANVGRGYKLEQAA